MIHAWNLDIRVVEISKDFSNLILEKILKKYGSISEFLKYFNLIFESEPKHVKYAASSFVKCLNKRNKQKYGIHIKILYKLCSVLCIQPVILENNLIKIKPSRSKLIITQPQFPISINPLTISLLFHFYGDGCYENWCQSIRKHPLNRKRFFQKMELVLGKIINWDSKKHQEIHVPKILYRIFSKLFNLPESLDKNNPPNIKDLSRNSLISALVSIIIDEGHIANPHYEIRISQKNINLIKIFYKICKYLNYEVSEIKDEGKIYSFKIKFFGVVKFYKDLKKLCDKHGIVLDLGDKQIELENLMKRINLKLDKINSKISRGYHGSIVEKDIEILRLFYNHPLTRKEIEQELQMSLGEVHNRIGTLKENKFIEVIGFKNKAHVYRINSRGKKLLKNWKNKFERDILLKQLILETFSNCVELPSIPNLCRMVPGLHIQKFYKFWPSRSEFENELRKFTYLTL